jgi:hypothetical protein
MQYEMRRRDDGILWMSLAGDMDEDSMAGFVEAYQPFIEASTEENPLLILCEVAKGGKLSPQARKILAGLGRDPRLGKNAILGVGRYQRMMASFINKAAGRDNIGFFESEEKALDWLNESR